MPRASAASVAVASDLLDERGHRDPFPVPGGTCHTDVLERVRDEIPQSHEAALEHAPGAPRDADVSCLDHLERDDRRVDEVPQFVHEETDPLVAKLRRVVEARLLAFARVRRDGARDRLVQTSIQRAEVIRAERRVRFYRQLGNGLTDVAIIVNDLRHGEPLKEKVVSVLAGAPVDLQTTRVSRAQRVTQLIQEQGDPMVDLRLGRRRNRSRGHFRPTTPDDGVAIERDELMQHGMGSGLNRSVLILDRRERLVTANKGRAGRPRRSGRRPSVFRYAHGLPQSYR